MAANVKIATDIFRQKWFRQLNTDHKALWFFLMAESNIVGVFEVDSAAWNFVCAPRTPYSDSDAFVKFGKRIQKIPNHSDKGIVVGKLDYQRSFGKNSAQWQWVEKALADVDLTYEKLQEMISHEEEQLELDFGDSLPPAEDKKKKAKELRNTIPPQLEWVREYCASRQNGVNPEKFIAYYESNGWKVGRNPMKDWQAAVRNWEEKHGAGRTVCAAPATNQMIRKVF